MVEEARFLEQLQRIGKLTPAKWAVWMTPNNGGWTWQHAWGITARRKRVLARYSGQQHWKTWLSGALASGRWRSRKAPADDADLMGERLYAFPVPELRGVLLVGGGALDNAARQIWRTVALGAPAAPQARKKPLFALFHDEFIDQLSAVAQRPDAIARVVVEYMPRVIPSERAYVAVLEGDTWSVLAAWGKGAAALQGQQLSAAEVPALMRLPLQKSQVFSGTAWPKAPAPSPWLETVVSLRYRNRLLGALAVGRGQPQFSAEEIAHLERIARRVGWIFENAFAFEEVREHLRRKAVVNDVFLSVLSSTTVEEAAANATRYLRRVMQSDVAIVLLPDVQGRALKVMGASPASFDRTMLPLEGSLCGHVFKTGKPARYGDVSKAPHYFPIEGLQTRSELCVPMRARREIVGVINLESHLPNAFDEEDERLLTGVAGQLALLLETVRLRHQTAAQARRMELVHQVVKDIVGLMDEEEIVSTTAQRLADYFGFEVTIVALFDRGENAQSGDVQHLRLLFRKAAGSGVKDCIATPDFPCPPQGGSGVVGYVLQTGESVLINETSKDPRYIPIPDFETHSELCVPIFSHEKPNLAVGIINIESSQPNAFTEEDRLALESVAGTISAVLGNARRYRQLNITAQHLNAARETALDIIADLEMETLLQRIVHRVRALLDVRGTEIGLLEGDRVRVVATENPWQDYTGYTFPLGKGVAGRVAASGEIEVVSDYAVWEGRNPENPLPAFRIVAGIPLTFHGETLGVLTIYDDREGRQFGKDEMALLKLLAPQIAIAIRNALLYQELNERMKAQDVAEKQLVQSERLAAVGEMAAAVAHELNSPLTTVMGFVELALEDIPPQSKTYEDLQLVYKEGRRARDIVRRLLDFARRSEPVRIATDINELVHQTMELVGHMVMAQGVILDLDLDDTLPLVQVDRAEIKQVFLNLVHNALNFMETGGQLRITTRLDEDELGQWVVTDISDTGIGMTPEQQMHIFEPFYTTRRDGTGMGLSVSYSIIRNHNGDIRVHSEVGKGSTFSVYLPVFLHEEH